MEQKAKWLYIGESTEWFIKGKIYAEDSTYTQGNATLKNAYAKGMCKIFLGEGGQPNLFTNSSWTTEFYRL